MPTRRAQRCKDADSPIGPRRLDGGQRIDYLRQAFEAELWPAPQGSARRARRTLKRRLRKLQVISARALRDVSRATARLPQRATNPPSNQIFRKVLKTAAALAIAVIAGWGPVKRLMQTTSVEAVVNAQVITLRSPIDGEVTGRPGALTVGAPLVPGTELARIINPRADSARLDNLRREIGRVEEERAVLEVRLASARELHAGFVAQTGHFREGRARQLEARAAEIRSERAAAMARRDETAAVLQRTTALEARGAQTRAALDKARRENEIAVQTIAAAEQRIKAVEIELDAARSGYFLGDSYNDQPSSAQRADELQQQITVLAAELRQRESRQERLSADLETEKARFARMSEATIAAPSLGSVWEVLTAPGEEVRRGQELARLLDCSAAVVTATVAESVYNRLRVGQPAEFRFRDGGGTLEGRVVHLTGLAAAPANFAIAPSALIREAYRVTVAIPGLAQSATCDLGRTGQVVFLSASDARATAALAK